jgi:hypothetical protein
VLTEITYHRKIVFMTINNKLILIIGLSMLISACGEVSYKRGASVRDIDNAHAACRGVPEEDFSACLQKQGWEIQKFDDSELFAEASVIDNRGMPAGKTKSTEDEIAEEATAESSFVIAGTTENKVAPNVDTQTLKNKNTDVASAKANTTAEPDAIDASKAMQQEPKRAKKTAPVDPLKTYKINSWWKFGGTPAHLKTDTNQCVDALGEAHQPDMATQTYTRGLIECLHKNGWKALKQYGT